MYQFGSRIKMTVGVHLLLLAALFDTGTGQGGFSRCFPNAVTYQVGQRANFACPRPCGDTGRGIEFYVFVSQYPQPVSFGLYFGNNRHQGQLGNDCADQDASTNGSVTASFVIVQQDSGTNLTIYCTDSTSLSPCDSLIKPVLIHVEESVTVCNNTTASSPYPVRPSPVPTISQPPVRLSSPLPVRLSSPLPVRLSSPPPASPPPVQPSSPSPIRPPPVPTTSQSVHSQLPASASATLGWSEVGGIVTGSFFAGLVLGGLLMSLTCGIGLIITVKNAKKVPHGQSSPAVDNGHPSMYNNAPSLSSDSSA